MTVLICIQAKTLVKDKPPKGTKESPVKTDVKGGATVKDESSESKSDTPKSISPAPSGTPPSRETPTIQVDEVKGQLHFVLFFLPFIICKTIREIFYVVLESRKKPTEFWDHLYRSIRVIMKNRPSVRKFLDGKYDCIQKPLF